MLDLLHSTKYSILTTQAKVTSFFDLVVWKAVDSLPNLTISVTGVVKWKKEFIVPTVPLINKYYFYLMVNQYNFYF